MAVKGPQDRCAASLVVIWSLGLALLAQGCSSGVNDPAIGSTGQVSQGPSTGTTTATLSPTTAAAGFKQDPVDPAFAKKLGAVCNDWNSFASSHQYPVGSNPQALTREELPKVGAWLDSLPINHELVAKATALGAPAAGATAWAHVLDAFAPYQRSVTTAATAAKAQDLGAWQSAEVAWSAARDNVREGLLEAGIGAQSTCSLPFIRPAGHPG